MTVRSEQIPVSEDAPLSRRERRAKGKQPKIPAQAFSASLVNQRQYAVRRRG
jgi:hypothetical protein